MKRIRWGGVVPDADSWAGPELRALPCKAHSDEPSLVPRGMKRPAERERKREIERCKGSPRKQSNCCREMVQAQPVLECCELSAASRRSNWWCARESKQALRCKELPWAPKLLAVRSSLIITAAR
jgi:hypothetical protein